jgi:carboxynorspermidine decarboxylase
VTKAYNNMDSIQNWHLNTPAFVYEERKVIESLEGMRSHASSSSVSIFFPLKCCSVQYLLLLIGPYIDGFSASSPFEAYLARQVTNGKKPVFVTAPALKADDIPGLLETCHYFSFNSLAQFLRYQKEFTATASCGLRVNPNLSFVKDRRYDPCGQFSKLGVPIALLSEYQMNDKSILKEVKGIHFHSNCESTDFSHLFKTVNHIDMHLSRSLKEMEWINLGGGYLLEEAENAEKLGEVISFLRKKYDVEVFFEPGKGIVGRAGYIVSSVVDIFDNDGRTIAILDTSVNHMPEVFEYQYKPDVAQESEDGKYSYILAGATCLAGDVFGEYSFDEPLEIGSRIVFEDMGAYTLVKANMFNGINLPSIYAYTLDGKLEMKRQFTYEDFLSRCGANGNVPL